MENRANYFYACIVLFLLRRKKEICSKVQFIPSTDYTVRVFISLIYEPMREKKKMLLNDPLTCLSCFYYFLVASAECSKKYIFFRR